MGTEQPDAQSLNPVIVPPVGEVNTDAVHLNVVPETREVGV